MEQDSGNNEPQPRYVPSELVNSSTKADCNLTYYCYLIELKQDYEYHISVHDIVLAMRTQLPSEIIANTQLFELSAQRGNLSLNLRQVETINLTPREVQNCRRFQITLLRILLHADVNPRDEFCLGGNPEIDYLLLPATVGHQRLSNSVVDWNSISCVPFSSESTCDCNDHHHADVWTKNGLVCSCKLRNCIVTTPHNDCIYIIDGVMDLNGNSPLMNGGKKAPTYKEHFKKKYKIELQFEHQSLLAGRSVYKVGNYLQKNRQKRQKEPSMTSYELPPELCNIIMSPISIRTIYSFTFVPSIMHRLESLLIAFNLKRMLSDHCMQNDIPIIKVLQAITTKECQEVFDYDSLETLGDSFLKYAATQQLFKTNQNLSEGHLTEKRKKMISNTELFKLGCSSELLVGFIRTETLDPKQWIIPGDKSKGLSLKEVHASLRTRVYACGRKKNMKHKVVADVVEALIGALLSSSPGSRGEEAAMAFMNWIGNKVDTNIIPYQNHISIPLENLVNVKLLESESLLNYKFKDPSLLVEALTHGSYKHSGVPSSYQRLEFLGDAVLDYCITQHFYKEYPNDASSGFLTVMRTISVNNECYAISAIKAKLHEHILHNSPELGKQIADTVNEVEKLDIKSTFGWELETSFSHVVADVMESVAGAIYVDSGYNKEAVFESIKRLLDPLVTPETARLHPIGELHELCQRENYRRKMSHINGEASVEVEVEANGKTQKFTAKAANANKKTAEKLASKEVLQKLLKVLNKI
ncbi:hypothetical protein PIB30_007656 [Stylosanthes scabra]|uniref:Uncharacterized protein n=1 Tax=Stylosanthes scabra TaxID=79078 RepID=A0ABU6W4T5_9FABA|nr:hypothetical protein [Stylosanthes scabra]